jgi:T-complex protein 1 subunit eta
LEKCAATSMNSKLIGSHREFFAPMVVDAVMHLDDDQDIDLIGIHKQVGGSMEVRESICVEVAHRE